MPWFKVDDKFHSHPKVMELTTGAVGLWTLAGTWCADYLTDGAIRKGQIKRLGGTEQEAAELVEAGLWLGTDDGWQFRDWLDYQPTRESVEAERDASRERQRKRREEQLRRKKEKDQRDKKGVTDVSQRDTGVTHGDVTEEFAAPVPVPVPEVPKGTSSGPPAGVASDGEQTTQALIGEWIDHCQDRPPGSVIGQLSKQIKALLDEGHDYGQVRTAVQEWNAKGVHPSVLPSVLHETRNKRPASQQSSAADRARQRGAERHQRIQEGTLGQQVTWADVFNQPQIEKGP